MWLTLVGLLVTLWMISLAIWSCGRVRSDDKVHCPPLGPLDRITEQP